MDTRKCSKLIASWLIALVFIVGIVAFQTVRLTWADVSWYTPDARGVTEVGPEQHAVYLPLVTRVNRPPVISNIPDQSTSENAPITRPFNVIDADGDPITVSYEIGPNQIATVAVQGSNGNYTLTITPTNVGATTVYIYASDGFTFDSEAFTVNIYDAITNVAPIISDIPNQTTMLGTSITIPFTVTDADANPITVSYEIGPDQIATVAVQGSNGNYMLTITPTQVGTAMVYIFASDDFAYNYKAFSLTVQ